MLFKGKDVSRFGTKDYILYYINAHPGCHMRMISRAFAIDNRTVMHHTECLDRDGCIVTEKDGKYTRYYPAEFDEKEFSKLLRTREARDIFSQLMIPLRKEIILLLLDKGRLTNSQISKQLNTEPWTITRNMKPMITKGIAVKKPVGEERGFYLKDPMLVRMVVTYCDRMERDAPNEILALWNRL